MKPLPLVGIAVICVTSLATADAYEDRKERQRDADKAYENRQQQQRDDEKAHEKRQQRNEDDKRVYENRLQRQREDKRAYEKRQLRGGKTKAMKECADRKKSGPGASDHQSAMAKQPSAHAGKHPDYDCMDAENEKDRENVSY